MNSTTGKWYDGRTALRHDVTVILSSGVLRVEGAAIELTVAANVVRIDPRLGRTRRAIHFPAGEMLEVAEDGFIEALEAQRRSGGFFRTVHRWENSLYRVFLALALLVVVTFCFIRFGIPALANRAALMLPPETERVLGNRSLEILDRMILKPSTLKEGRRRELTRIFNSMKGDHPERQKWRLLFRSGGAVGANAFALPSGLVVVTDQLVAMSASDNELKGVMAHEMGHLIRRHALRHLLQNSATALLIATITGDIASITSLAATMPTVIVDAKYSRDFELEADDIAVAYLKKNKIPVQAYAGILARLGQRQAKEQSRSAAFSEVLMDHPSTRDRIKRVQEQGRRLPSGVW